MASTTMGGNIRIGAEICSRLVWAKPSDNGDGSVRWPALWYESYGELMKDIDPAKSKLKGKIFLISKNARKGPNLHGVAYLLGPLGQTIIRPIREERDPNDEVLNFYDHYDKFSSKKLPTAKLTAQFRAAIDEATSLLEGCIPVGGDDGCVDASGHAQAPAPSSITSNEDVQTKGSSSHKKISPSSEDSARESDVSSDDDKSNSVDRATTKLDKKRKRDRKEPKRGGGRGRNHKRPSSIVFADPCHETTIAPAGPSPGDGDEDTPQDSTTQMESSSDEDAAARVSSGGGGGGELADDECMAARSSLSPSPVQWYDHWRDVWRKMKEAGWSWKRGDGLVDYYYVLPGGKTRGGVEGRDFFTDERKVKEFAMKELGWGGDEAAEQCAARRLSINSEDKSTPVKNAVQRMETIDEGSPIQPGDDWKNVWDKLMYTGWTYKPGNGLVDWYYILPGGSIKDGKEGRDFFTNEEDVRKFVKDHFGWMG